MTVAPLPGLHRRLIELDAGEAYAITLAEQLDADLLIIDEKKGRAAAASSAIRYMGLAGVLIEAKHKSIIPNLSDILQRITVRAGFRLSRQIQEAMLKAVGEL